MAPAMFSNDAIGLIGELTAPVVLRVVPLGLSSLLSPVFPIEPLSEPLTGDATGSAGFVGDADVPSDGVGVVVGGLPPGCCAVLTMIETALVVCFAPPVPELPKSLLLIVNVVVPRPDEVGSNRSPLRAALILAIEPKNVMVESRVPSPALKVKPDVLDSVNVPLLIETVTRRFLASASPTVIAFPLADEKTKGVTIFIC